MTLVLDDPPNSGIDVVLPYNHVSNKGPKPVRY